MTSEAEMRERFTKGFDFPPLVIQQSEDTEKARDAGVDAFFDVEANDDTYKFAAEFKSRNSPRIFEDALIRTENVARRVGRFPMLVVPYLSESQLDELQRREMSGIDLSGNGIVIVPGKLLVYRTGKPNKFPDSAPTKYAYRGATSLVARAFLCRGAFQSLADIEKEIAARGGSVVLSTISKALKRMESDLIVDRTLDGIRLRQADKLLEALTQNFSEPKDSKRITCSVRQTNKSDRQSPQSIETIWRTLLVRPSPTTRLVLSGRSSLEAYAIMGRQEWPVLYTQDVDYWVHAWGNRVEETSRFVDLELRQTQDPTVYFDVRMKDNLPFASPIQVFLECMSGDKREREIASQVKEVILRELKV